MEKNCNVIGVFPPPYGGVTIKCKLFYELLQKHNMAVKYIDVYEINRRKYKFLSILLECIKIFRSCENIIYCMDSKRLQALLFVQCFFKKSLERTTIIAMGGVFPETLMKHRILGKILKMVKSIWVETEGMKLRLEQMEFTNIRVFPNPKSEVGCCLPKYCDKENPLKLVFFSKISVEKGCDDIIKLVQLLNEKSNIKYTLDFYGHIASDIKEKFENFIKQTKNVNYCGVFDATQERVYQKLNEYDVLLFPTRWYAEGIPGILIEAKMAGIAVIASNHNYNDEIIRVDESEGFLIKQNYVYEMYKIIQQCDSDREYLYNIKLNSYQSRKRYSLEKYECMISLL